MRVAMTGSSGMVGSALRAHLEREGHEVVPVRHGRQGTEGADWDPERGWVRPGLLEGCDAIVHLAGASIGDSRWTAGRKRLLRDSRIEATRGLVDHLATLERKPGVLVSASAIGYYGDRGEQLLEESAAPGEGFLADLVRDWESEARRAESLGMRTVQLRLGIVLAKDGGALPRLVMPMKFGVGGRLGPGRQVMSWVELEDVVRAFAFALEQPLEGAYNVVAPSPATNADLTKTLGRVMHRPSMFPVPGFALKLLLGEMAEELLLYSQRVSSRRLTDAGFRFAHPELEGALRHALESRGSRSTAHGPTSAAA